MIPSSFMFLIDLIGDEIIDFYFSASLASRPSPATDPSLSNRPTLILFFEF